jgi:lysyl-tRNA synthetase class 2
MRPLPEKWHGLKDTEVRYRQRYVTLSPTRGAGNISEAFPHHQHGSACSGESWNARGGDAHSLQHCRSANARPFITFHNALSQEMYLRIATELYLKRLIVGCSAACTRSAKTSATRVLTPCTIRSSPPWRCTGPTQTTRT